MEIQEELFGPDFRTQAVRPSPGAGVGQPVGAGAVALSGPAEQFAINTPPPNGVQSIPLALEDASDSPERILMNQSVEELWQNDAATHTEDTMEQDERYERLAALISTEDNSQEGL
eukprot:5608761-Karenia_brevis.AAC.1